MSSRPDCTREETGFGICSLPRKVKDEGEKRRRRTVKTMKCDGSGVEKDTEGKGKGREESHAADDKDTSSKIH
jgi:hypothetical protein